MSDLDALLRDAEGLADSTKACPMCIGNWSDSSKMVVKRLILAIRHARVVSQLFTDAEKHAELEEEIARILRGEVTS